MRTYLKSTFQIIRHPREDRGPLNGPKNLDSRLRGNDAMSPDNKKPNFEIGSSQIKMAAPKKVHPKMMRASGKITGWN
jgi:hypothetical protein